MGYMREYWIIMHTSPILYRYIDWSITVPLQMIEFNLILVAVKPDLDAGMFWRLLLGTVAMLSFGYAGETHSLGPFGAWLGFVCGLSGWGYILFEIFAGEAGNVAGSGAVNKYVQSSFQVVSCHCSHDGYPLISFNHIWHPGINPIIQLRLLHFRSLSRLISRNVSYLKTQLDLSSLPKSASCFHRILPTLYHC